MKTYSLIKAVLSQDMNMFNYSAKRNSNKFVKTILPIILFLIVASRKDILFSNQSTNRN